jgi:hypothetical protein
LEDGLFAFHASQLKIGSICRGHWDEFQRAIFVEDVFLTFTWAVLRPYNYTTSTTVSWHGNKEIDKK